jgi:hypothetical protein
MECVCAAQCVAPANARYWTGDTDEEGRQLLTVSCHAALVLTSSGGLAALEDAAITTSQVAQGGPVNIVSLLLRHHLIVARQQIVCVPIARDSTAHVSCT